MKTLSTIFMTTALAFATITATGAPASAEYYGGYNGYGSYGGYSFYGVPGGYPDLSYIFHPHSIYQRPHYDAYRTDGHPGGGHVQRCLARYQTYNPATDLYFKRPGVAARCRL